MSRSLTETRNHMKSPTEGSILNVRCEKVPIFAIHFLQAHIPRVAGGQLDGNLVVRQFSLSQRY